MFAGEYLPQCTMSDEDMGYKLKQCHGSICWCVDVEGEPLRSTMTRKPHPLTCDEDGKLRGFETCDKYKLNCILIYFIQL